MYYFKKRLKRDIQNKMLGGVCSGIADYFEVDPVLIRIIFVVGSISAYPFILLYIILWIITPKNEIEVKHYKEEKFSNE